MNRQTLQLSDDSCENIMEYMSEKGFHYDSLIYRKIDYTKGPWTGVTPGHGSFASRVTSILTATTSDVSYAAARNIFYTTSGRILSIQDIAYIHGMNRQTLQLSDDSCENIMEYMSKKGFYYVPLIHREVDRTKGLRPGVTPGHGSLTS